jgi:hypothetical protein
MGKGLVEEFAKADIAYNEAARALKAPTLATITNGIKSVKIKLVALKPLVAEFDKQYDAACSPKMDPKLAIGILEGAYGPLNTALKEINRLFAAVTGLDKGTMNMDEQRRVMLLDAYEKRVSALSNNAKMWVTGKVADLQKLGGTISTRENEMKNDLVQFHLFLRKGADDGESSLKKYISQPNEANLMGAFASSVGLRSLCLYKQQMKKLLEKYPELATKFQVPQDSANRIAPFGNKNTSDFFRARYDPKKLQTNWPGLPAATNEAKKILANDIPLWRVFAEQVKTLYK